MLTLSRAATVLAGALFVAIAGTYGAEAGPSAESFGNLPAAEFARLSPDGKRLAVIKPADNSEKFFFVDLTQPNSKPIVVGMQEALAADVIWKSNDRAICIFKGNWNKKRANDVHAWSRAMSVDLTAKKAVLLMNDAPGINLNRNLGGVNDIDLDDPDHVLMSEVDQVDIEYVFNLYQVDVATGSAHVALLGNRDTIEFLTDGHGKVVGQIDQSYDDLMNHLYVLGKEVLDYPSRGGSGFEIAGLTSEANPLFAVKRATSYGTIGLYRWLPAGFGAALFENPNYDLGDAIQDERTRRVIGVTYTDDTAHYNYFDPAMQRVQDALEKAFPGQSVAIVSKDSAGDAYVVLTDGPKNPPILSLYTPSNHQVSTILETYPDIKPSDLGDVKAYPYQARDGQAIHAYLTLPPGKSPHNLPTVIFPHGGPEDRDSMADFDWWAQFMATRGYAVLQPNFRGSSGYGLNFIKAGDGEWAGKVQYDVQDGVRKLIADGIADPKRICIVGGSYGGYMALAGATFSPDLYNCAISVAGLSDLHRMLETGTTFDSEVVSVWKRRIGSDVDDSKLLSASPANFAGNVKIPILLIHGEKDTTVPIEQSEIESDALKNAGKQVEFVRLAGDDHHLDYAATRIQLLKEIERFLAAHIGN
jgi:dipeptidyl aminopeptidase/acylaminoacyl peptidase